MAAWWLDRVVPGLVVTLLSAPAALWFQHRALSRKMHTITRDQTDELKRHFGGGGGDGAA